MTPDEKLQAFYIAFALVLIDAAQRMQKKKSARWNRLDGATDALNRAIDLFPPMSKDDQDKASVMFDFWEADVTAMYGGQNDDGENLQNS